jgi:hypothetical protein
MQLPISASASSPTLLAEVFDVGETLADFRDRLPADSPTRIDLERPVDVAGAELAFRDLADLRVLAIVEDWCKDSRDALPVLDVLLAASPGTQLRVVHRDEHMDLMAAYLKDGRFAAIPVFIFMDRDFNELGRYVERPPAVTRLRRAERESLAAADPRFNPPDAKPSAFDDVTAADLRAAVLELRARSQPQATLMVAEALADVADQITEVLAGRASAAPASSLLDTLANQGPLQIVDVGDDDCEIEPNA